jgi:hypothetical protein
VFDANSAGPLGIDALGLGLTGQGIHIGQVENGRPGLRTGGFDNNANSHADVTPAEVFFRNNAAVANQDVTAHATGVAGVMIASGAGTNRGFAQNASLHSSAFKVSNLTDYPSDVLSMQQVAMRNGGDVPAIIQSATFNPVGGAQLDGNSLASEGLDYLAQRYNTLFDIATDNDGTNQQIPGDAYDGLVVASAKQAGPTGQFRKVDTPPAIGANNRRLVDLIAPGEEISVPEPTADGLGTYKLRSGTSNAAPHATGTVALLQEDARTNGLGVDSRRHEVMKAILMNSADKVQGRLGMTRTVVKRDGVSTWDNSDARDDPANPDGPANPLDPEMGVGFLNARRAKTQLDYGEWAPDTGVVGPIGWDYTSSNGQGNFHRYSLPVLKGGSWISITLTWDRQVDLINPDGNGLFQYDPNDPTHQSSFGNPRLSDLDLYLVPANGGVAQHIMASQSALYNVEHIFFQLPAGDARYDILVRQFNNVGTNYAIAWWSEEAPAPKPWKVGSRVWSDTDGNGIQDAGEPGVPNVTVQLYTASGTLLDTTTMDYYGNYQFEVDPGHYFVQFVAPYAQGFTLEHAGSNPDLDSDADPVTGQTDIFTVSGSDQLHIDAGLVALNYGSIGSYVWNDTDGDGIQDPGERGVAGVTVDLYTAAGDYVTETTTDSTGHYLFTTVAPGSYYVAFTAPTNYGFTLEHAGSNPDLDSDVNPVTGQTDVFTLALGENQLHVADAGLVLAGGSIGEFVWLDNDQDGIQNPNEPGVPDVTVKLYTASGSLVATTTTDDDGYYLFSSVAPGSYYVVVELPPSDPGYQFTTEHAGNNPDLDSDVNPITGKTDTFGVALGESQLHVADAGLVYHPSIILPMNNFRDTSRPALASMVADVREVDAGLRAGKTSGLPPLPFPALAGLPPVSRSTEPLAPATPERPAVFAIGAELPHQPAAPRPQTHRWFAHPGLVVLPIGDDGDERPFSAALPA